MTPSRRNISIVDLLLVAFFICFAISNYVHCGHLFTSRVMTVSNYAMLYCALRMLIPHRREAVVTVLLGLILFGTIAESFFGFSQLLGMEHSNNFFYPVTGHFMNPGPFGGFVAATGIVATVFCVRQSAGHSLYVLSLIAAIATAILLPVSQSRAALAGYVLAAIAVGLNEKSVRSYLLRHKWITAVVCLFIFSAGVCMYYAKKPSADGRLFMSAITSRIIKHNWAAGTCNFAGEYGKHQCQYFIDKGTEGYESRICGCPDNAFNEYLQVGADYGLMAMVLFAGLMVTCCCVLVRHYPHFGAGCIALGVFAMFSYPFDMIVFKVLLTVFLSVAACCARPLKFHFYWMLMPVLLLYGVALPGQIRYQNALKEAAYYVRSGDSYAYREQYGEACSEYGKAFETLQCDYEFLFKYGHTLHKAGEYSQSNAILMQGAGISSDPMFHDIIGKNWQGLGEYAAAEQEFETAFLMVPNRLYPLYLLAKLYYETGQKDKFTEMARRVESFIPKVESPATERLKAEIRDIL